MPLKAESLESSRQSLGSPSRGRHKRLNVGIHSLTIRDVSRERLVAFSGVQPPLFHMFQCLGRQMKSGAGRGAQGAAWSQRSLLSRDLSSRRAGNHRSARSGFSSPTLYHPGGYIFSH